MKKIVDIQAKAPGKLILSGEHAVVYGYPALVMAVNRYVTTTVQSHSKPEIIFTVPDLKPECSLTVSELMQLQKRIQKDYQSFLKGEVSIRKVLREPIELVQFAISLLLDVVDTDSLTGFHVNMQTDLLIGCGMGSSAAVVLSVLKAVIHYLQVPIQSELLFTLAHQAETMQHGKSSGLDLKSSWHGGCLYFKDGQITARTPSTLPFYLINTGQPHTTTGECVAAVAPYFKNTQIGEDFANVTNAIDEALQFTHQKNLIYAIRENHKLLKTLGVVPEKVQQLIAAIEREGGAAKISGAGAVSGHHAGAVWVLMEDEEALKKIDYSEAIIPIQCETRGVHTYESH